MKRQLLAAAMAAAGLMATAVPSLAQYYPYPPQPRHYYHPNPYHRPDPYGYRPYRPPVVMGNLCVTSRGNCYTRPRPNQSPCACNIPGFGVKRGAIYVSGGGRW